MNDPHDFITIASPCGIFSFTDEGVISYANQYCCKMLAYKQSELVGSNISAILTIAGRIFYQTHLYPLIKLHEHAEEIFINFKTLDKKDLPVVLNAVSQTTQGATVIICSFIPVFNRRKYEDEILLAKNKAERALEKNEELEKVKGELEFQQKALDKQITLLKFQNKELVSLNDVITHDLQEPVRKLIFFSNELLRTDGDEAFKTKALRLLKSSSERIKNLLLNLQDYLSLSAPLTEMHPVNLQEIVQFELSQLTEKFNNIQTDVSIDELPTINGDRNQIKWLFHHVLINAFEHGCVDDLLKLKIQSVEIKENLYHSLENRFKYTDYLKITISDEGPGFDPIYKEYIFEVLKKLNTDPGKLGFGLAICKRIAENHWGHLWAEGNPGKGAIFNLLLPIINTS